MCSRLIKYIFPILTLSFLLAGELEVEGDLKVVGNVQIGTIDSLEQVILQQQQQISTLQALILQLQTQITLLGQQAGLADCNGVVGGSATLDCTGVCDGDAQLDNCGVCDSIAENDCSLDECGIWGGDSSSCEDECGVSNGNDECLDECGVPNGDGSSCYCIDFDGNSYETVQIGEQVWMAENLRVTHYSNGDEIQGWNNNIYGAYALYENDEDFRERYGLLYNGYIPLNALTDDNRRVCPDGWDIPTDDEFGELEVFLGMCYGSEGQHNSEGECTQNIGWRGNSGGKLKEIGYDNWNSPNIGATDEYGFGARASGRLNDNPGENFMDMGIFALFWTSTEGVSGHMYVRGLYYDFDQIYRVDDNLTYGYSIRCIQD